MYFLWPKPPTLKGVHVGYGVTIPKGPKHLETSGVRFQGKDLGHFLVHLAETAQGRPRTGRFWCESPAARHGQRTVLTCLTCPSRQRASGARTFPHGHRSRREMGLPSAHIPQTYHVHSPRGDLPCADSAVEE